MEKIILKKENLKLFDQGNKIHVSDNEEYLNYPYWIKPIEEVEEGILCEIYNRAELPIKKGFKAGGLKVNKYIISKSDGSEIDPEAWYFVLRVDEDPHAQVAALSYATSVIRTNKQLALELIDQVVSYKPNEQKALGYWNHITDWIYGNKDNKLEDQFKLLTWKEFKDKIKL